MVGPSVWTSPSLVTRTAAVVAAVAGAETVVVVVSAVVAVVVAVAVAETVVAVAVAETVVVSAVAAVVVASRARRSPSKVASRTCFHCPSSLRALVGHNSGLRVGCRL